MIAVLPAVKNISLCIYVPAVLHMHEFYHAKTALLYLYLVSRSQTINRPRGAFAAWSIYGSGYARLTFTLILCSYSIIIQMYFSYHTCIVKTTLRHSDKTYNITVNNRVFNIEVYI